MTTPDYKALCAELVAAWEKGDDIVGAMNRARSALAEGVGVGPTDEELETLVIAIQALVPIVDDGTHLLEAVDKGRDILRRALHNYGTTHPRPIPVAERLPSVADCDGEGRCWWFHPGCEVTTPFWYLADCGYPDAWLPAPSIPLPGENNG
jgi:hypothetical protein